jgi:uncharacterized membrane protein YgcG
VDSDQYEELCRHFIAQEVRLRAEDVKSVSIPNAKRPGLPEYKHQIDLYWENADAIAAYLNIANAKWRGTAKVDQGEVLLLQVVRQKVAAHKAFVITNVGFTAGAIAAAKDDGIALHIVGPNFDVSGLPRGDRVAIQGALRDMASQTSEPLYMHHVELRGLGFDGEATTADSTPRFAVTPNPAGYETRVVATPSQQVPGSVTNRSISGGETRGGVGPGSGSRGGGGVVKK